MQGIMQYLPLSLLMALCSMVNGEVRTLRGNRKAVSAVSDGRTRQDLRVTVFESLIQNPNGSFTVTHDFMAFPIVDGKETSAFYSIDLPTYITDMHYDLIEEGHLFLSVVGVTIQDDEILINDGSIITVIADRSHGERKLSSVGNRDVAVLRVGFADGPEDERQVSYSASEIYNQLFVKDVGLKNQLRLCSNGKVDIRSLTVHEVTVPGSLADYTSPASIRNTALDVFKTQENLSTPNSNVDHVMVILPKNDFAGFVGNAGTGSWISTLNDKWALDVMVYMHEIGHVNIAQPQAFTKVVLTDSHARDFFSQT